MKTTLVLIATLFAASAAFAAQQQIEYTPVGCFPSGDMAVLQATVHPEGELRAYFRRVNTTDWCSVVGINAGPLSAVTMPKFENNDEIEYFFVVLDGKKVIAKSPQVYRAKVTDRCDTKAARHLIMIVLDCAGNEAGSMPTAMGAGYSLKNTDRPCTASPDTPEGCAQAQ